MKKPDLFLVGAPRCGTTALYTYLKQHPEIFLSRIKEPQFFAGFLGEQRRIQNWPDYLSCFAGANGEKRIGEASVAYLAATNSARDIEAFSPEARIIIMLRNPLDVMHSLYHLRRFNGVLAAQALGVSLVTFCTGVSARPGRMSARYSRTGMASRRQLSITERMAATRGPA